MEFENLLLTQDEKITIVKINRPDKLNALNLKTISELKDVFIHLKDNQSVNCIILTGTGDKAFAAGADISELARLDEKSGKEFSFNGQETFNIIENMNKPVIAAVNGFALGGGCELALACHIRIASDNAKFGQPEVNLGIIPGYGGTQRLTKLINRGRALEYILTGDAIDANEALRIGLVNKVFPQSELLNRTVEFAKKITSKGQFAIRKAIDSVNASNELSLVAGLNFEAKLFSECCNTEDFKEGTSAFLEKRKPIFRD